MLQSIRETIQKHGSNSITASLSEQFSRTDENGESPTRNILEKYRLAAEAKKKDPIYSLKSLAVIEENSPYEYQELEESLINFLLTQVVVMREKPFYEATTQLEKNINMNKIMYLISKLTTSSQFASKQEDKNFQIAMANRKQLKMTQPYDGFAGLRADSEAGESDFAQKVQGKATFKVKAQENA